MLLVIDVGNTNIVFGVYKNEELIHDWRIASDKNKSSDEYGLLFQQILANREIAPEMIDDVIISSVVPNLMHTLPNMIVKYFHKEPIVVEAGIKTGLNICYDNPKEVGADRIVNAVGALKKYGGPLIVIDIGTAITFCVINEKHQYLGGLILPGIGISADALFTRTSKLPKIEIVEPGKVIAKTTVTSMQSGLYYGFSSMIDGIIDSILKEANRDAKDVNIVATGGFATMLVSNSKYDIIIDRYLTLDGLQILYEMNH